MPIRLVVILLLAAFVYDGFGRLIRTQRWDRQGNSELESYYYDGVRRIQERIDDDPNDPNSPLATREYVWGPGYVDEIVCQIDEQGDLLYYLQDANYNVVAVTDEDGAVVAQYAYEPYGGVVAADTFTTTAFPDPNAPPINRIGHQGLFFERLYVDADDPNDPNDPYDSLSDPALSPPVDPNLATPLPGLYQVRNRVLIPNLGRFAQRDMNETALPIITALVMNAQAMDVVIGAFSTTSHYMAGLNLYTFGASNPVSLTDPLGLNPWDDPFNAVDEFVMMQAAERAMALAQGMAYWQELAIETAKNAVLMGIMATGPIGLLASSGYMLVEAGIDISENGLTWSNGAAAALAALPWVAAAGSEFAAHLRATERSMQGALGRMQNNSRSLSAYHRGNRMVPLGVCWLSGTPIITADANVRIESIDVGERVLTSDWMHAEDDPVTQLDVHGWLSVFGDDSNATNVDRQTWRLVELRMPNPQCPDDIIEIRSLRPLTWIRDTGCRTGESMWYELPEMGLAGTATVESVAPCPEIEHGIGRVVLSTVTHLNGYVRRIWLEGHDEPLEPTNTHRLYSEDRGDWVPVEELAVGERLRTVAGPVRITRIDAKPGVHRVYNLEVETEHCYYVSTAGVLSHNTNPCGFPGFTSEMLARSRVIAKGAEISKVDDLVSLFGGTRKKWTKKKGFDEYGYEWHWYEHHGIGRVGIKPAGAPDPF